MTFLPRALSTEGLSPRCQDTEAPITHLQKPPVSKPHPSLAALTQESSGRPSTPKQPHGSRLSLSCQFNKSPHQLAMVMQGPSLDSLPFLPPRINGHPHLRDQGS